MVVFIRLLIFIKTSKMSDDHKKICTNKSSIGGLIEVHVSSIVKWSYQDNFKPVFFFMKRFAQSEWLLPS